MRLKKFATKQCKIKTPTGVDLVTYEPTEAQIRCMNQIHLKSRVIILKDRQVGATTLCVTYALWNALFHDKQRVLIVMCNQRMADHIATIISGMITGRLKDDLHKIHFKNGSYIRVNSARVDTLCSESVTCLIIDEAAYIDDEALASVMPLAASPDAQIIMMSSMSDSYHSGLFYDTWHKSSDFKRIRLLNVPDDTLVLG